MPAELTALRDWAIAERDPETAARCEGHLQHVMAGATAVLAGPTGERNTYTLGARGTVLCVASTASGARAQLAAVLATGNKALFSGAAGEQLVASLPASIKPYASTRKTPEAAFDAVLFEGDSDELMALVKDVAKRPGPIVSVQGVPAGAFADDAHVGEQEHGGRGRQCEFDDDRLSCYQQGGLAQTNGSRHGDPGTRCHLPGNQESYELHDEEAGSGDVYRWTVAHGNGSGADG